jgi:DnaJ-class molecular chaperone
MSPQPEHYAHITTPRGSVVSFTGTAEQMAAVTDAYGPPAEAPDRAGGDDQKRPCSRCNGAGGWYETVKVPTPSGGEVVTQKWVNCRPCGGTGKV